MRSISQQVSDLSFHALRVELHRRQLSTSGLRQSLEERLLQHLSSGTRHPSFITVPVSFPSSAHPLLPCPELVFRSSQSASSHDPCKEDEHPTVSSVDAAPTSNVLCDCREPQPMTTEAAAGQNEQQRTPFIPGVLRVRSVWVCGERNMRDLWQRIGPIGKANLSRSAPSYSTPESDRLKGRALRQLLELEGKPTDFSRVDVEHLQLTLVEAYYASFVAKALHLCDSKGNSLASPPATWRLFNFRAGPTFAPTFVAYARYKAAGWLPRSGLKYGVDWVLYPVSMKRHTHSPYCVVLNFTTAADASKLDRSWVALQNRLRLVKNVAKTLIVAEVAYSPEIDMSLDVREAFKNVTITELTIDRWVP